ncbi:MAG: TIGR02452 family protein [Clostridiales bacterium]|nr:TIGR02452 family protein [Clostridiales bacterium]
MMNNRYDRTALAYKKLKETENDFTEKEIKESSKVYGYRYINEKMPRIYGGKAKGDCMTNIRVLPKTTASVIYSLGKNRRDTEKIGVLNFASRTNPGGGFLRGALAQEESLCHESNLYLQLEYCRSNSDFYNKAKLESSEFYDNSMIVTKTVFNDAKSYTVITCGAVNQKRVKRGNEELSAKIMKQRMNRILDMFYMNHCDTLILGAFGCGVFGNSPELTAKAWKELLNGFGDVFKEVYFAVPPSVNLDVFKAVFK